jgi:ABC-type multidrug transport system fused ATPase/permease subunit
MHNKLDFVSAAILDTQSTIRAIDVKVAALLVGIVAPLPNINRIFFHLNHFGVQSPRMFFYGVVVLFLLSWLLALIALVRAIGVIDNPAQHIINASNCKGMFYAGGLYSLGIADVFFNRNIMKASKDLHSFVAQLPDNEPEIETELVFEQMKLAYIRDIKINRLRWGLQFSLLWLVLGIAIYLCSKYLIC